MKVRDLIVELLKYPMSMEVVLTEGNEATQRTPCGAVEIGCFFPNEKEFYKVDYCHAPEDGCTRAVCIGPVN